jgi:two-component system chemotaxis response regulator CheY
MNMPNKDGIELVREVRKMECYRKLPILMATTESESLQRDMAIQAGVTGFISKPFTGAVLLERLEEMLNHS